MPFKSNQVSYPQQHKKNYRAFIETGDVEIVHLLRRDVEDSPEDCEGPGADLALFAIPLPNHPEIRVFTEAEG